MKYVINAICCVLFFNIAFIYSQDKLNKNFTPVSNSDNLPARITKLEEKVKYLEDKVAELENLLQTASGNKPIKDIAASEKWKDKTNWRKLQKGMGKYAVMQILGEPTKINGGYSEFWYYSNTYYDAYVVFDNYGSLVRWYEP